MDACIPCRRPRLRCSQWQRKGDMPVTASEDNGDAGGMVLMLNLWKIFMMPFFNSSAPSLLVVVLWLLTETLCCLWGE